MGAPVGNQNARKRHWSTAIESAVLEKDARTKRYRLHAIAGKLIEMAEDGDIQAMKEIGDRLDGKPHQSIDATVDGSLTVEVLKFSEAKK